LRATAERTPSRVRALGLAIGYLRRRVVTVTGSPCCER